MACITRRTRQTQKHSSSTYTTMTSSASKHCELNFFHDSCQDKSARCFKEELYPLPGSTSFSLFSIYGTNLRWKSLDNVNINMGKFIISPSLDQIGLIGGHYLQSSETFIKLSHHAMMATFLPSEAINPLPLRWKLMYSYFLQEAFYIKCGFLWSHKEEITIWHSVNIGC